VGIRGLVAGVLTVAVTGSVFAAAPPRSIPAAEIPLPTDYVSGIVHPDVQSQLSQGSAIRDFQVRHAGWTVALWDERTETPARAYGPAIPLLAAPYGDAELIEAGLGFIEQHAALFGVGRADLSFMHIRQLEGAKTVFFKQEFARVPVYGGRIFLRVDEDGRLTAFGSEVFPRAAVNPWPSISELEAIESAKSGLPFVASKDVARAQGLYVLPVTWGTSTGYFLTYVVDLSLEDGASAYSAFVDASTGRILGRRSTIENVDFIGEVTGDVVEEDPAGPQFSAPMAGIRVFRDASPGNFDFTDRTGNFLIAHTGTTAELLETRFNTQNERFNCNRVDAGPDADLLVNATPGVPVDMHFDATNSILAERSSFQHLNQQRWEIIDMDPSFPFGAAIVSVQVNNASDTCNAQWQSGSSTILLFKAGGGCIDMGEIPSVSCHEYGHGLSYWAYGGAPLDCSMIEALPDMRAHFHTGISTIGTGWQGSGTKIRDGENTKTWAQAVASCPTGGYSSGECHCKADVTMGAVWKMRKNYIRKYGDAAGGDLAQRDAHFAMYQAAQSPQAFLLDVLAENDNDGDLTNGTVDWTQICDAFAIHGLPCPALQEQISVTHTPQGDTSSLGPYTINATVVATNDTVDEAMITYRVNGGSWSSVAMSHVSGSTYTGDIPGQSAGVYVEYYLSATSTGGATGSDPTYAPGEDYLFVVGTFETITDDQMEVDSGWTIGSGSDTATGGMWVRDDPNGTTSGGQQANPENDHTSGAGTDCFFTGQGTVGGGAAAADLDGGCTTLTSPIYDLSGSNLARVRFWRWFFNPSTDDDDLTVDVSSDGGSSWTELNRILGVQNSWTEDNFLLLPTEVALTSQMRFRFVACDADPGAIVEAGVDDFVLSRLSGGVIGVEEVVTPKMLALHQNSPNPFNPMTTINYEVPAKGDVRVEVFNVSGQLVRTLVNELKAPGLHSVRWDGTTEAGVAVASGSYYYKVIAGGQELVRKMTLLK
jgi:hypothetical protein